MANFYITEQGSRLRKTGERVYLELDEKVLQDIPCRKLDAILIFGNVQVTTQALSELLEQGIELALLTRHGRLKGQLTPPKAKNVKLRFLQYQRAQDESYRLQFSKAIVRAKIASACAMLERARSNYSEPLLGQALEHLKAHDSKVEAAPSTATLLGLEGAASRDYFEAFARMNRSGLVFDGRNRRPPRDPVNALLSFGYTLIANELQSLLDAMGFDPYIGFYHEIDYGRPSLALDLMEEFRHSLVDRFTLHLLNQHIFSENDFYTPTYTRSEASLPRVCLTHEALKRYFQEFEKWMTAERLNYDGKNIGFRLLFRRQAEKLARAIEAAQPYQPWSSTP
jgi:CRISPR-associated protein Cas1